ncbi:MAG TPA: hypothetical protein VEY70_14670 [Metabacillus sp.]|nr:hypothetical protein [Metabacillus sp.]
MSIVHFVEENTVVLCQLLDQIPSENDPVKIKGRKGKVISVKKMEDLVQVHVFLEKKVKNQPLSNDKKKKR